MGTGDHRRRRSRVAVLVLATALLGAALVRGPGEAAAPEPGRRRVAVVLSVGGLGDRSFNDMAHEGLVRARHDLDVVGASCSPSASS